MTNEVPGGVDHEMVRRVSCTGITLTSEEKAAYVAGADSLGVVDKGVVVPTGYKRCGGCGESLKFYLFNQNSSSKTNTSGSCKKCQTANAAKSYSKTKSRRNYKAYYQANKDAKQAQARKYYADNKETLKHTHAEYLKTAKGQRVMKKAHAKRRRNLAANKGVPYTREMVVERDGAFSGLDHPICYLCTKPIEDISGSSLHIDHIIPVVAGGLDCFTNVASTHAACNLTREKDARELQTEQVELIMALAQDYIDTNPDKFQQ